jgi:hypothetical protein
MINNFIILGIKKQYLVDILVLQQEFFFLFMKQEMKLKEI